MRSSCIFLFITIIKAAQVTFIVDMSDETVVPLQTDASNGFNHILDNQVTTPMNSVLYYNFTITEETNPPIIISTCPITAITNISEEQSHKYLDTHLYILKEFFFFVNLSTDLKLFVLP